MAQRKVCLHCLIKFYVYSYFPCNADITLLLSLSWVDSFLFADLSWGSGFLAAPIASWLMELFNIPGWISGPACGSCCLFLFSMCKQTLVQVWLYSTLVVLKCSPIHEDCTEATSGEVHRHWCQLWSWEDGWHWHLTNRDHDTSIYSVMCWV